MSFTSRLGNLPKTIVIHAGAFVASCTCLFGQGTPAAAEAHDATELAKKTQNPVGDIVSVPFQFNFNSGGPLQDSTIFNLNFQPVIPIRLSPGWTLITRTIVPINSFPTHLGSRFTAIGEALHFDHSQGVNGVPGPRASGIGDIQEETFFTPAKPGRIIWGIGPAFSLPTATVLSSQTGTWAAGGSAVVLAMEGPWVLGALVTQLSPLTDANGPPRVNSFLLQYFVNYNFGKGWALTTAPSITANWDAERSQQWTVPAGGGISRTFVMNKQPMSLGFQYYRNVKRPDGSPSTLVRFTWSLIFPTAHH